MYIQKQKIEPNDKAPIQSMDISPDGQWLAVMQSIHQNRSVLSLYNTHTLNVIHRVELRDWLLRVRFLSNSQLVFSTAGTQAAINLISVSGASLAQLFTQMMAFPWIDAEPSVNRFVAGGAQLWVLEPTDNSLSIIWKHEQSQPDTFPLGVLSRDHQRLFASELAANKIQIYDVKQGTLVKELDEGPALTHWIGLDTHEKLLLVLERYAKGVFVWNIQTGTRHVPQIFNETLRSMWSAHFHPSGDYCVLGNLIGYVTMFKMENGEEMFSTRAHQARVWDVKFTPDGQQFFTAGEDGVIHLWQLTE